MRKRQNVFRTSFNETCDKNFNTLHVRVVDFIAEKVFVTWHSRWDKFQNFQTFFRDFFVVALIGGIQ